MPLGLISPTNTVSDFLEASNASQGGPRSLISRLTSQFGPKSRTIVEFVIHADDPHRRYSAGDLVTGSIILKLVKATRITHIVISLYGYVQVFKNPNTPPSEGYRAYNATIGKAKPDKKGQYLGNGFATLFEDEQVVCREGRLEEGNYKFEFAIRFPDETLPSTIDVCINHYPCFVSFCAALTLMIVRTWNNNVYGVCNIDTTQTIRTNRTT